MTGLWTLWKAWLCFSISQACVITANVIWFAQLAQVNRKLPDSDQLPYFGGHWGKMRRVDNLYQHFFPQGRLTKVRKACMWGMAVSLLGTAWFLRFFR